MESPWWTLSNVLLGSLSNDDGDVFENGKKATGLDRQNNNFARASRFFVHFFAVIARLRRENAYFHVLWRTRTQHNDFLFIFLTFDKSVRIQPQKKWPIFDERQKSHRLRSVKKQLCTCITLFCTFLCRHCTATTWKCLISRFVEDVNTTQRLSFYFPDLR